MLSVSLLSTVPVVESSTVSEVITQVYWKAYSGPKYRRSRYSAFGLDSAIFKGLSVGNPIRILVLQGPFSRNAGLNRISNRLQLTLTLTVARFKN